MRRILYIFSFLLLGSGLAFSQEETDDMYKLFDDAEYFFTTGDYQEAVLIFLKLTKMQPDNANFNFRTLEHCRCISNRQLETFIRPNRSPIERKCPTVHIS